MGVVIAGLLVAIIGYIGSKEVDPGIPFALTTWAQIFFFIIFWFGVGTFLWGILVS